MPSTKARQKILLLFDFPQKPPADGDFIPFLRSEGWENEWHVYQTLKKLGYDVKPFGLHNDIDLLFKEVRLNRPDLVFNLCESFQGDREHEGHVAAFLDLLGLPYTGASAQTLMLCKDKSLTKSILAQHNIRVPRFIVSRRSSPLRSLKDWEFPAFIKPLNLEASEGIAQNSLAQNENQALQRIQFLHEKYQCDVIVEEYIDGREIYVGVLGRDNITVFPSRELHFRSIPAGKPRFASYRAKWDDRYRKRWGIVNGNAKKLSPTLQERIKECCHRIYSIFQMRGYGRIDLRLSPQGEVVFLEANPNPSIAKDDDFAQAAKQAGFDYESLIAKIVKLAA